MVGAVAAVDLGASSGRVIIGHVGDGRVHLETVRRFPNEPVELADGLHWDVDALFGEVRRGLDDALARVPELCSVGVDSWAVDYALLRDGTMLAPPFHYRDARNDAGVEAVYAQVTRNELFRRNGLQFLPFNTVFQLATEPSLATRTDALLLIPDLITFWLSGEQVCERTNASTTGLLDIATGDWDLELMGQLGIPSSLFQPLTAPGTVVGGLRGFDARSSGVNVTTVGSHDTASAVVGVPMRSQSAAYISCGTWGLVGLELDAPVLSADSQAANFTNEGGVDGRVRFLRNVMGLWLLSESIRQWEREGKAAEVGSLVEQAAAVTSRVSCFDVDDPRFLAPGDIPARIREYCAEHDQPAPRSQAEYVRCIVESLAQAFASSVRRAQELTGRVVDVVHVVGGGSQNRLLCQLTADAVGRPVLAGPVEATALGNVLVQARAQGLVAGDLEELRAVVAASYQPVRYEPDANREAQL